MQLYRALVSHVDIYILQNGESEYRNAGFYQALSTTTLQPESSQPIPTLLPGLSMVYSYMIIGVLVLVVAVILCIIGVGITFCCCKHILPYTKVKGINYWTKYEIKTIQFY